MVSNVSGKDESGDEFLYSFRLLGAEALKKVDLAMLFE